MKTVLLLSLLLLLTETTISWPSFAQFQFLVDVSVVWNVVDQGHQGRVPSHVSVASDVTSVVATSKYFGITRRSPAEINARRVICPKDARGAPGSRDYTRHQESATKALPHIFVSAKHFHANSEGEASNKYANLQSEYAGDLAKIKNFKWHMDSWDMSDVGSLCHS